MGFIPLFIGCFILYGRSNYFPENFSKVGNFIKKKKQLFTFIGYLFLVFSYILLGLNCGWSTGFGVYIVAISLMYSLLVIVLTFHKKIIYLIDLISVLLIIIENIF